jgi:hypothetical protein
VTDDANMTGKRISDLCKALWSDERGFILSGELAMVSTIGVLGLVAGLSEVSGNVQNELKDVGRAYGSMDQSFQCRLPNGTSFSYRHAD